MCLFGTYCLNTYAQLFLTACIFLYLVYSLFYLNYAFPFKRVIFPRMNNSYDICCVIKRFQSFYKNQQMAKSMLGRSLMLL